MIDNNFEAKYELGGENVKSVFVLLIGFILFVLISFVFVKYIVDTYSDTVVQYRVIENEKTIKKLNP